MGYSIFDETMVDMTWPEIEQAIHEKAAVLFPLGVIEEHGPHLGLAVDIYISYLLAKMVRRELDTRNIRTLIAPPFYWGINTLTGAFPGSFDVRPETLKAVLRDTFQCLQNWGVRKVFTLNAHGEYGHNLAILEAVREAYSDTGLKTYCILNESEARSFKLNGQEKYAIIKKGAILPDSNSPYLDLHAGSMETAIMLKYYPEQAKADIAKSLEATRITFADFKAARPGGEAARKLLTQGYLGNPAAYDLDAAQEYMETRARDYAVLIEKVFQGQSLEQ